MTALQTNAAQRPVVEVAVGVVFSSDAKQLLFGQRPAGKPYAGWWEFPGGKLEAGESVEQALTRELYEELGITATKIARWAMVEHDYPHAYVRLHFCRVLAFTGTPSSKENQALRWLNLEEQGTSSVEPMLPAAIPVLRWLTLPNELWFSRVAEMGLSAFVRLLESQAAALARSLPLRCALVLREPSLEPHELAQSFEVLATVCQRLHLPLLLASQHERLLDQFPGGAQGLHLTAAQLHEHALPGHVRPQGLLLGGAVHNAQELALAAQIGLDYVMLGPVMETGRQAQMPPIGWAQFAALAAVAKLPVFAFGGMRAPLDRDLAWQYGAHGIALEHDW
jgi:8-oxo-dGTP diphosphatase